MDFEGRYLTMSRFNRAMLHYELGEWIGKMNDGDDDSTNPPRPVRRTGIF